MNIDLTKILSILCIIAGVALFFIFLGDLIIKIIGAAAAIWLISYGLGLQGKTITGTYFELRSRFRQ